MASGFDDIFAEMTSMNAEMVLLSERLKLLEEQATSRSGSPSGTDESDEGDRPAGVPVCWDDLAANERAALWPEFIAWVLWLADRYELVTDQLPRSCWWMHGAVIEELTALWTSHQSAYSSAEDGGSAPYLWQDALARAIERIGRNWLGTCRNGQHKERHREPWGGDEQYSTQLLREIEDVAETSSSSDVAGADSAAEVETDLGGDDASTDYD